MSVATCQLCRNTGAVGERYCTCEAALALRVRIDNDPRMRELRAKIDRNLGEAAGRTVFVRVDGVTTIQHTYEPEKLN